MMMDGSWGWGTMMFGGAGMVLLWGLGIVLTILVVRGVIGTSGDSSRLERGGGDAGGQPSTPLEILQRRYAGGEISREEYEVIRRDLTHT